MAGIAGSVGLNSSGSCCGTSFCLPSGVAGAGWTGCTPVLALRAADGGACVTGGTSGRANPGATLCGGWMGCGPEIGGIEGEPTVNCAYAPVVCVPEAAPGMLLAAQASPRSEVW